MTSTSKKFFKNKNIADLCKAHFCISKSFIQCNTGICCVHITDGANIYLYVSVYWPMCPVCVFVCVSGIKSDYKQKPNRLCVTFGKFDVLLHETHIKVLLVLMYQGSTSLGPKYH